MAHAPWLSPFSLPSSNLRSFSLSRRIPELHLPWSPIPHLARRSLAPCCSAKKSRREKASRKSNEELCAELREFISAKELPENRVPSLKFLCENGRKDLANLVRRRGVKSITELLLNSNGENHSDKTSEGNQNSMNAHLCELSGGHNRNINVSPKYTLTSNNYSLEDMLKSNSAALTEHHVQVCEDSKSSIDSLHLKEAKCIQTGELDTIEGSGEDCELHQDLAYKAEEDDQNDINLLKSLLHRKAMELSHLKQQIDDEKLVLSNMQVKARAELGDIRRMTANKDAELQAAEENLNGLKEVHIDYWANGQIVEVAGSFNGWQHRVKMDLHPSPECTISPGKPMLWSTVLWLYPGVYEIKFIIDGDWRIDSQREIITSGGITNNVLRVDR